MTLLHMTRKKVYRIEVHKNEAGHECCLLCRKVRIRKLKSWLCIARFAISLQAHTTALNTGSLWLGNGDESTQDSVCNTTLFTPLHRYSTVHALLKCDAHNEGEFILS